jgi:hypothetical protein
VIGWQAFAVHGQGDERIVGHCLGRGKRSCKGVLIQAHRQHIARRLGNAGTFEHVAQTHPGPLGHADGAGMPLGAASLLAVALGKEGAGIAGAFDGAGHRDLGHGAQRRVVQL